MNEIIEVKIPDMETVENNLGESPLDDQLMVDWLKEILRKPETKGAKMVIVSPRMFSAIMKESVSTGDLTGTIPIKTNSNLRHGDVAVVNAHDKYIAFDSPLVTRFFVL